MQVTNELKVLDNPIWTALSTRQRHFSVGDRLALRFNSEIGPLSGIMEQSPEAYGALSKVVEPGQPAILFLEEAPELPRGWRLLRHESLTQMIFLNHVKAKSRADLASDGYAIETLTPADISEMLALVAVTEPGPFKQRTIELGNYLGIRIAGRLAAMAGERLAPPGFTEVSAVCTHPDFRGRGLAQILVSEVARTILERGETPFLTVLTSNRGAIRVYEAAGFSFRRNLDLAVVTWQGTN